MTHLDLLDVMRGMLVMLAAQSLAMLTPGPNMALMLAVAGQRPHSLFVVVTGFASAGLMFSVISVAMLSGAMASGLSDALPYAQLAGSLYLGWLGVRWLQRSLSGGDIAAHPAAARGGLFAAGFLTNASNPKTLAFFSSILAIYVAQVGNCSVAVWAGVAAVFLNSLLVHWSLGRLLQTGPVQRGFERRATAIGGLAGSFFIVLAAAFGYAAVRQLVSG